MDDKEQKRAAEKFVEFWQGKGYEKGQTQAFWLSLLREVFGVKLYLSKYLSRVK